MPYCIIIVYFRHYIQSVRFWFPSLPEKLFSFDVIFFFFLSKRLFHMVKMRIFVLYSMILLRVLLVLTTVKNLDETPSSIVVVTTCCCCKPSSLRIVFLIAMIYSCCIRFVYIPKLYYHTPSLLPFTRTVYHPFLPVLSFYRYRICFTKFACALSPAILLLNSGLFFWLAILIRNIYLVILHLHCIRLGFLSFFR